MADNMPHELPSKRRSLLSYPISLITRRVYFAGEYYLAGGYKGFAGDFRLGVAGEEFIKDGVGELVGHFVGVAFGNGFRCEEIFHI